MPFTSRATSLDLRGHKMIEISFLKSTLCFNGRPHSEWRSWRHGRPWRWGCHTNTFTQSWIISIFKLRKSGFHSGASSQTGYWPLFSDCCRKELGRESLNKRSLSEKNSCHSYFFGLSIIIVCIFEDPKTNYTSETPSFVMIKSRSNYVAHFLSWGPSKTFQVLKKSHLDEFSRTSHILFHLCSKLYHFVLHFTSIPVL